MKELPIASGGVHRVRCMGGNPWEGPEVQWTLIKPLLYAVSKQKNPAYPHPAVVTPGSNEPPTP